LFWKYVSEKGDISLLNSVQFNGLEMGMGNHFSLSHHSGAKNLPTWISDWDVIYRLTLLPWAVDDSFKASKGMPLVLHDDQDSDSLIVDGIEVGTISFRSKPPRQYGRFKLLGTGALGEFFRDEHGFHLLARTLVADRDEHGFLLADTGNISADFAAYILYHADGTTVLDNCHFGDILLQTLRSMIDRQP
jgi:hypothetical protein